MLRVGVAHDLVAPDLHAGHAALEGDVEAGVGKPMPSGGGDIAAGPIRQLGPLGPALEVVGEVLGELHQRIETAGAHHAEALLVGGADEAVFAAAAVGDWRGDADCVRLVARARDAVVPGGTEVGLADAAALHAHLVEDAEVVVADHALVDGGLVAVAVEALPVGAEGDLARARVGLVLHLAPGGGAHPVAARGGEARAIGPLGADAAHAGALVGAGIQVVAGLTLADGGLDARARRLLAARC